MLSNGGVLEYLSQADVDRLLEAYAFLRRVENRLQMVDERQTQAVPPPGAERERLAHSLELADAARVLVLQHLVPLAIAADLDAEARHGPCGQSRVAHDETNRYH